MELGSREIFPWKFLPSKIKANAPQTAAQPRQHHGFSTRANQINYSLEMDFSAKSLKQNGGKLTSTVKLVSRAYIGVPVHFFCA